MHNSFNSYFDPNSFSSTFLIMIIMILNIISESGNIIEGLNLCLPKPAFLLKKCIKKFGKLWVI